VKVTVCCLMVHSFIFICPFIKYVSCVRLLSMILNKEDIHIIWIGLLFSGNSQSRVIQAPFCLLGASQIDESCISSRSPLYTTLDAGESFCCAININCFWHIKVESSSSGFHKYSPF
jgi:hypothetical protein